MLTAEALKKVSEQDTNDWKEMLNENEKNE